MRLVLTVAFVAVAAAAVPAFAKDGQRETPTAEKAPPKEELVCRKVDNTGSRTGGKKVCMTREQWREVERQPGY